MVEQQFLLAQPDKLSAYERSRKSKRGPKKISSPEIPNPTNKDPKHGVGVLEIALKGTGIEITLAQSSKD